MTIWLIGGTQESVELSRLLRQANLPTLITVATESARSLYAASPNLQIQVGRLNHDQIANFLQTHQIQCILDASHPFAVAVSRLAIAAAEQYQIPYLRYERPTGRETGNSHQTNKESTKEAKEDRTDFKIDDISSSSPSSPPSSFLPDRSGRTPNVFSLDSFHTLLDGNYLKGHRVLLTVGYRPLELFQSWHDRATLFARILPSLTALDAAFAAGFTNDRLIAFRPPLSVELERALWQQWQISMVVTKASGAAGGEDIKQHVATELGVTLIVIDRPAIAYPQQTSDLQTALRFCQRFS